MKPAPPVTTALRPMQPVDKFTLSKFTVSLHRRLQDLPKCKWLFLRFSFVIVLKQLRRCRACIQPDARSTYPMPTPIRVDELVKRFRSVAALDGLAFEVPQNSVYALVGSNGAGKTTAIKTILNILNPTSGRVEVLGTDSRDLKGKAFETIGYVSENQELPDWMSVQQFLNFLRPFYPTWDPTFEKDLVRRFDLPPNVRLKALSRGMRMKAALAGALAYRPKVIILDEPFSGLDPLVRDELIESLATRTFETALLLSSHDMLEIESLANYVGYLQKGKLLFSEEMKTLLDRFREVKIVLSSPPAADRIWPASWLQVDAAQPVVRFVESKFDAGLTPQSIREFFGGNVHELEFAPMSLRSIFVAIARSLGA